MEPETKLPEALLDRYEIQRLLGSGAYGQVFLAFDKKHSRQVALKVVLTDLVSTKAAERFLREIEISAQLNHPNVVPLFDSGQADGVLYFVMPYSEGESLREKMDREGPFPFEEVRRIGIEVAEALAHAHDFGVIHRDIKPENILITQGHAMVADFGVATAVSKLPSEPRTDAPRAIGTAAYMSPEQAVGAAKVDSRSDIYSLGCVLYEMVGGKPPFLAESRMAILGLQLRGPPPPLKVVRGATPVGLQKVISQTLEKAPAERFRDARELVEALADPGLLSKDSGRESPLWTKIAAGAVALGAIGMVVLFLARDWIWPPMPDLDPDKVVVFPLSDRGRNGFNGAEAALSVIMALEHAAPLIPLDPYTRLEPNERADIDLLPSGAGRELALQWGAGHFVTGSVTQKGDSIGVSLTLFDTHADTVIGQRSRMGVIPSRSERRANIADLDWQALVDQAISQLTIASAIELSVGVVDPGREIDFSPIEDRDPAAIVQWVYGEREYRLSRFSEALTHFERALELDPLLVFAGLKGSQAASWIKELDRAQLLLERVLPHIGLLPARHQRFARGLNEFTTANPDAAVELLELALHDKPDWSEAHMALGEVYHHLFPSDLVVDSSDVVNFRRAAELDPGFLPPLVHLAEDAIRKARREEADSLIQRLAEEDAWAFYTRSLRLMYGCAFFGLASDEWETAASIDVGSVLEAGLQLAVGGYLPVCAEAALTSVLEHEGWTGNHAWGALLGLQGLFLAQGRTREADDLLVSAMEAGYTQAQYSVIVGALAGAPWDAKAAEIVGYVEDRFGEDFEGLGTTGLWLMGAWNVANPGVPKIEAVLRQLSRIAESGDPTAREAGKALDGQLALIRGDSAQALSRLLEASPRGSMVDLQWSVTSPLPTRHLSLAKLLLSQGSYREAFKIASTFDHPGAIVFLPFLRSSLDLRLLAAEGMGNEQKVAAIESRLQRLGWSNN